MEKRQNSIINTSMELRLFHPNPDISEKVHEEPF